MSTSLKPMAPFSDTVRNAEHEVGSKVVAIPALGRRVGEGKSSFACPLDWHGVTDPSNHQSHVPVPREHKCSLS